MSNVVDIFNNIAIPRLFALNTFNVTEYPKMKISTVVAPDTDKIANYISKLAGAKMPLFPDVDLENYLRTLVNFPEVTEDEELRARQEKAAGLSEEKNEQDKHTITDDPKALEEPDKPEEGGNEEDE